MQKKLICCLLVGALFCVVIGLTTHHTEAQPTCLTLTKEQKEIVKEGRYLEYIATNYGGSHHDTAFLTVEQAHAYEQHLSATYNIPMSYFTNPQRDVIYADYDPLACH